MGAGGFSNRRRYKRAYKSESVLFTEPIALPCNCVIVSQYSVGVMDVIYKILLVAQSKTKPNDQTIT